MNTDILRKLNNYESVIPSLPESNQYEDLADESFKLDYEKIIGEAIKNELPIEKTFKAVGELYLSLHIAVLGHIPKPSGDTKDRIARIGAMFEVIKYCHILIRNAIEEAGYDPCTKTTIY